MLNSAGDGRTGPGAEEVGAPLWTPWCAWGWWMESSRAGWSSGCGKVHCAFVSARVSVLGVSKA